MIRPRPLAVAWATVRETARDHLWAAREAVRCYRETLAYRAEGRAEAEAHKEAERQLADFRVMRAAFGKDPTR